MLCLLKYVVLYIPRFTVTPFLPKRVVVREHKVHIQNGKVPITGVSSGTRGVNKVMYHPRVKGLLHVSTLKQMVKGNKTRQ